MAEEPECQLRRRRSSGNPNLPLNLELGYTINEGGPSQGTPTPSCTFKLVGNDSEMPATSALQEFRKKQQSFDNFDIQIEECEEEEIIIDSDDEGDEARALADRPITPMPIQDFGANVVHTEGKQSTEFLKVRTIEHESITDVSDADSDED